MAHNFESPKSLDRALYCKVVAPPMKSALGFLTSASNAIVSGTDSADGSIVHAMLDTMLSGSSVIGWRFENAASPNFTAVFTVQGSVLGGDTSTDWFNITCSDETGTAHASHEITVAAGGSDVALITPGTGTLGAPAAFRYYRVVAKNGSGAARVRVYGYCK